MKRIYYIIFLAICSSCLVTSCDDEKEIAKAEQSLALSASSLELQLDEAQLDEPAITFTWTKAVDQGADFKISYLFKLDKQDNDFNSSIPTIDLGDGVYSKSFTHGELQRLLIEKWKCPADVYTLFEARVIGKIEGPHFIKPEVSTISVAIKPFYPMIIEAKKVFLRGTAVTDSPIEVKQTYEDEDLYAYKGFLKAGEFNFLADMIDGSTKSIAPQSGENSPINDGGTVDVWPYDEAEGENYSWNIPEDGSYRIILNKRSKTLTVYSEKTDIKPIEVIPSTMTEVSAPVTAMYIYGEPTFWEWTDEWKFNEQSQADPNIWIFKDKEIKGRTKFGVMKHNESFVFSADPASPGALDPESAPVTMGVPMVITGGRSLDQRNSYFQVPGVTKVIILNLTDMTVTFKQ